MVYLFDKNKEAMLDFDNDDVRPYFSLENVIKGMFYVANQLYGIKFIEQKTFFSEDEFAVIPANYIPVWHKDVRYFSVFEESGEYIGGLCLDLHPRRSKRDGAWSNTLREWYIGDDGKWHHPIAVVYTNLPKSTLETPSLLSAPALNLTPQSTRYISTSFLPKPLWTLKYENFAYPSTTFNF